MGINYYVVGSTYYPTDRPKEDMFDHMVSRNVVSIHWAGHMDLSTLYGKPQKQIIDYLKKREESSKSYSNHKHFLNLKPDDMIAVKKWNLKKGEKGRIIVLAYARVVKRQGRIYGFDRTLFGHMINVEYIECKDVPISFPFNYAQTIHHVTNPERIRKIFGSC